VAWPAGILADVMEQNAYAAVQAADEKLRETFEALRVAVGEVVAAEVEARRQQWRDEMRGQQAHETYMRRRRDEAETNRREAAVIRGEPDPGGRRRCTVCGKPEGVGAGEARFYQRKARPSPQCTDCEKRARTIRHGQSRHLAAVS
jgi:hypothetical protein